MGLRIVEDFGFQVSAQALAVRTAGLIKKETNEHRITARRDMSDHARA